MPPERMQELLEGADPSMGELRKLATALKVGIADLLPQAENHKVDILFRNALTHGRTDSATASSLSRKMSYSADLIGSSGANATWWLPLFKRGGNDLEEAEENARIFRATFCRDDQLGPLPFLPKLVVERMHILLFVVNSPKMDGASAYFEAQPFIFVSLRFKPRMLFTLAHELGHLIAHHDPRESGVVIDEREHTDLRISKGKIEQYAHAFASSLLMPRASVGLALQKIRALSETQEDKAIGDLEILFLSRIFCVSFEAAAMRCEILGLIPEGGAFSLNQFLKQKYGSAEKRAEDANLPPRPSIEFPSIPEPLLVSAIQKIRAGEISIGKASALLGLSISDLISANAQPVN